VNTFPTLIARLRARKVAHAATARRGALACESLEGRRLLNSAWAGAPWTVAQPSGATAQIHHSGLRAEGIHTPGAHDFAGAPGDFSFKGATLAKASPQVQADFKTLQADTKAFEAEIPATVTASLKADAAVVRQTLEKLGPAGPTGHPAGPRLFAADAAHGMMPKKPGNLPTFAPGTDPSAAMTTMLQKAGVPAATISDLQANQATIKALDPTLQAKIATDQATLAKDTGHTLPPSTPGGPGFGPGGPMMF
jgi:hypothetical protein